MKRGEIIFERKKCYVNVYIYIKKGKRKEKISGRAEKKTDTEVKNLNYGSLMICTKVLGKRGCSSINRSMCCF